MTTGRINQVAFLRDAARPPRRVGGRGAGAAVARWVGASLGTRTGVVVRGVRWVRERCASPGATRPAGVGGTRGAHVVPRRPFGGVGWRANVVWPGLLPPKGRQHKNRPLREPYRLKARPRRIGRRQFGGRARSQPAATIQAPLTRPRVPAVPTPPPQPRPASPWAREQVEAEGGAGPTPLGVRRHTRSAAGGFRRDSDVP